MFEPQKNRKIPVLMATQHPDNANRPFWSDKPFISTNLEMEEIYQSFFKIGCDEYMWDWEGKFADEAMIERLLSNYLKTFQKHQLGVDRFITLRIPNIWEEKTFKLARAYMSVLSAAEFVKSLKLHTPPVFELILPMTKKANQLIHIQQTFKKTAKLHEQIFGHSDFGSGYIHIVPIFESVNDLIHCTDVLRDFFQEHKKMFKAYPPYIRAFIARSDPALNAGFPAAVLATRMALREIQKLEKEFKIPIYPIIGTGSLPFRGGINPENIKKSLPQYKGARTVSIQSAFRYDYPLDQVKKALAYIKKQLSKPAKLDIPSGEFADLKTCVEIFQKYYHPTIQAFAPMINSMSKFIPSRRERVQHIGLFGYNRSVGKVKLPRAIQFTGACYSMGIPPEFVGTGRGLLEAQKKGLLPVIEKHFSTMRSELKHAGKFLNRENLERYATRHAWAKEVLHDVILTEKILGIELGPKKEAHFLHRNLTSNILYRQKLKMDFSEDILNAAVLRKSIG